jgi:hypothetical protein
MSMTVDQKGIVRVLHTNLLMTFAAAGLAIACAASGRPGSSRCTVVHIESVISNPVAHAGHTFCGEVYAVERSRIVYVLALPTEPSPLADPALLVTTRTIGRLQELSSVPQRYYIEARIDPQVECFVAPVDDEECSPFRRPVFLHVRAARRIR